MSGATYELCASTIVYGKAKNNFKYSVFCIAISFLNDYVSKYSKAQIKCQQFFKKNPRQRKNRKIFLTADNFLQGKLNHRTNKQKE